tara:strand:+ start:3835 stop:4263 length:429 start_codon:yes stop_codon:yes gene_type:complete
MHNEIKGANMPFNIKQADNQAASLRNPGVSPATNNRMRPPAAASAGGAVQKTGTGVPGLSSAPSLKSAGPMPPQSISQATPTSIPNSPSAGIAPSETRPPVSTQGSPMTFGQANAVGTSMRRNDPSGLPAAGLRGPRNPRIA